MSRLFYHVMQDNLGNLLFDVTGTVRHAGTGTLATIYGDAGLTIPVPNPMTNHPSYGSFKCYLGAGTYDVYLAKSGYSFETLTGLQGWGTMAQQDASNVVITGGVIGGATLLNVAAPLIVSNHSLPSPTAPLVAGVHVAITAGTDRYSVLADDTAPSLFSGAVGIGGAAPAGIKTYVFFPKASHYGLAFRHSDNDTGPGQPVRFLNTAGNEVGLITTTASATAYNTTSDARLKDDVTPLSGALDVVRALKPVSFRWKADGMPGHGFLAHEVQAVIPDGVITGEKDAVDAEGNVQPQMIDYSKLVPHLIGAVKELTEQVEMLAALLAGA